MWANSFLQAVVVTKRGHRGQLRHEIWRFADRGYVVVAARFESTGTARFRILFFLQSGKLGNGDGWSTEMYHQKMLIDGRHVCCDLTGAAMGRGQEEPARRTPVPPLAALRSRYVSYTLQ